MRAAATLLGALLAAGALPGCLSFGSDPTRHYYVLATERRPPEAGPTLFPGLVRVRDLDTESAYDRFSLVLRKNPYELTYRQRDVWAVKPSRMIADVVAATLVESGLFAGVTRELSERRPQFLVTGDVHAIEIVDGGRGGWSVHLSLSLILSHFQNGATLWTSRFERTRAVEGHDFVGCVAALSALVGEAMAEATHSLAALPAATVHGADR